MLTVLPIVFFYYRSNIKILSRYGESLNKQLFINFPTVLAYFEKNQTLAFTVFCQCFIRTLNYVETIFIFFKYKNITHVMKGLNTLTQLV